LSAKHYLMFKYDFSAPQVAPRNFKLTAVSPYCVSLSYDPVEFANGPESGLVYQVKINTSIVDDAVMIEVLNGE